MRALFFAKMATLVVALSMLILNRARYQRRPSTLIGQRVRMYGALSLAAVVLMLIHPFSPSSIPYVVGLLVFGLLLAYAVILLRKSRKLGKSVTESDGVGR